MEKKKKYGQKIHKILNENVASIFLWSLNVWYVLNTDEINESNKELINSDNFFTTPHKWKPNNWKPAD